MVVNGLEGNAYDYIYGLPVFSPDSQSLAYAAETANKEMVVINGQEGRAYDFVLMSAPETSSIIFDSPDRLHYLAELGNDIYLAEERLSYNSRSHMFYNVDKRMITLLLDRLYNIS